MPVPRLKEDIRIAPFENGSHDRGLYLVEVGDACLVVNEAVHGVLLALRECPETPEELARIYELRTGQKVSVEVLSDLLSSRIPESLFSHTPYPAQKTPFIFSFRLIPERLVRPLSSVLSLLFSKWVVLPVLCAFVAAEYWVFSASVSAIQHQFPPVDFLLLYLALVGSTLFHELGHAAACHRYRCPHGDIGFALYFIYPAFYTDVTKAWRLTPRRRAVVDIGGVYFQCILIVALAVYVSLSGSLFALRVIWLTQFTLFFTLNPIFKMDGYWLLSDLSGLTNLHKQMREMLACVFGRLAGRPAASSLRGARLKVLYAYATLAALYSLYLAQYLFYSVRAVVLYYPAQARWLVGFIRAAWRHGDSAAALRGVGWLAYVSAWPLLLSVILLLMLLRLARACAQGPLGRALAARVRTRRGGRDECDTGAARATVA
jgi:putative peptide zinc metalloprotease protein